MWANSKSQFLRRDQAAAARAASIIYDVDTKNNG